MLLEKGSNRLAQYRIIRNLQFVKNVPVKYNKVKPIKTSYIPVSTSKLHFSSYKYPFSLQLNWYYRRKSISFGDIYTKEDKRIWTNEMHSKVCLLWNNVENENI